MKTVKSFFRLVIITVLCIGISTNLISCGGGFDYRFAPLNFPGTTWKCEDIGVSFNVTEDGFCKGKLVIDGVETNVVYYHGVSGTEGGHNFYILSQEGFDEYWTSTEHVVPSDFALFWGLATYKKNEMRLRYAKDGGRETTSVPYPYIFGKEQTEFVFYKQ